MLGLHGVDTSEAAFVSLADSLEILYVYFRPGHCQADHPPLATAGPSRRVNCEGGSSTPSPFLAGCLPHDIWVLLAPLAEVTASSAAQWKSSYSTAEAENPVEFDFEIFDTCRISVSNSCSMSVTRPSARGTLGKSGTPLSALFSGSSSSVTTHIPEQLRWDRLLLWSWHLNWYVMDGTRVVLHQLMVTIKVLHIGIQRCYCPYPILLSGHLM